MTAKKTPQDHRSATEFIFVTASGEELVAPKFKRHMTMGVARRLRKLDEADQMFTLAEEALSEEALSIFDSLDQTEGAKFVEEWQADSGVELGESPAS